MADAVPKEKLRQYLRELKPEAKSLLAAELERVAPLDKSEALVDQTLELNRAHFRAILFQLRALLRVLVAVEIALDALDLAVEEIDEGP